MLSEKMCARSRGAREAFSVSIIWRSPRAITVAAMAVLLLLLHVRNNSSLRVTGLQEATCNNAALQGSKSGSRARVLVSMAARPTLARLPHFFRVLDSYLLDFKDWDVDVVLDTDAESVQMLVDAVHGRYPRERLSLGKTVRVQLWSESDLDSIYRRDTANNWEGSLSLLLTHVHRNYIPQRLLDYDYFIYSEDDMLLTPAHLSLWLTRYSELWDKSWMFSYFRTENSSTRGIILPDIFDSVPDAPVYVTPSGHKYVLLSPPYAAMYVMDREQMRAFMQSGHYISGLPCAGGVRERMAFGWNYHVEDVPSWWLNGHPHTCTNRALVPLTEDGRLDMAAGLPHLPNTYADVPGRDNRTPQDVMPRSKPLSELEQALPVHPSDPCAHHKAS